MSRCPMQPSGYEPCQSVITQHSIVNALGLPSSLSVRLWFAASLVASLARIALQLRFRDRSTYRSLAFLVENTRTIVSFANPKLVELPCADSLEKYRFCLICFLLLECRARRTGHGVGTELHLRAHSASAPVLESQLFAIVRITIIRIIRIVFNANFRHRLFWRSEQLDRSSPFRLGGKCEEIPPESGTLYS